MRSGDVGLPDKLEVLKTLFDARIFAEMENDDGLFVSKQLLDVFGMTFYVFRPGDMVLLSPNEIVVEGNNAVCGKQQFNELRAYHARASGDYYGLLFSHIRTVPYSSTMFHSRFLNRRAAYTAPVPANAIPNAPSHQEYEPLAAAAATSASGTTAASESGSVGESASDTSSTGDVFTTVCVAGAG